MKYLLKAITTNNRDLKTAIYLGFEDTAYLFNCPDGFQRMALNQKMKFQKVRYVFLSNLHPDFYGGFPGFYLSAREGFGGADLKDFRIGVFGPKHLRKLIKNGKYFYSGYQSLDVYEYGIVKTPFRTKYGFQKNKPLFAPKSTSDTEELKQSEVEEEKTSGVKQPTIFGVNTKEELKQPVESEPYNGSIFQDKMLTVIPVKVVSSDQRDQECYSFICIPKQSKGKFLPKKALELGCNVKSHFKILNDGQAVTLEDGTIVHPFQVMESPSPSQSMILMFIPNENYLEQFLLPETFSVFEPYFSKNIDSQKMQMHLIYHSVPLKVLLNDQYRDFMLRFGSNVKHIIDCHETNDEVLARTKSYCLTNRHKTVCPSLIPLSPLAVTNYELKNKEVLDRWLQDIQYHNAKVGLIYNLYPLNSQGLDTTQVITNSEINNAQEEQICHEIDHMAQSICELRQKDDPSFNFKEYQKASTDIDDNEPTILFLGTVSMKPTMYRSASAIYLFIRGHGILMDCAEGSYGQIYDHFQTIDKVNEAVMKLRVAFITHIHGDHQLGIIKIIQERDRLHKGVDPSNKLYVVTPTPMLEYLQTFVKISLKYPEMVVFVPSNDLNPEPTLYYGDDTIPAYKHRPKCPERDLEEVNKMIDQHQPKAPETLELLQILSQTMKISKLFAIETDHCIESYGCLLISPEFGRIFYSGDTRPCQNVMNYCQKITLLIHEATFEDGLQEDALHKRHSTMGEAIQIAEKCQVWRSCLTHFSPRYQKIAEISDRNSTTKTMVAFDHMRIKLSYFEWAYKMLEVYRKLFTNDDTEPTMVGSTSQTQGGKKSVSYNMSTTSGSGASKCLEKFKHCLALLIPSLRGDSTAPKKDDVPKRSVAKKSKYQRINNPKNEDDDEDDDEEEFDEEQKRMSPSMQQDESQSTSTGEESQQFFNEFSSWRVDQQVKTLNNDSKKQTELAELKKSSQAPPPMGKKNLMTMTDNEIEKQKNTISVDDHDDLFKSFQPSAQPIVKQEQQQEKQQQNQLNSFFSSLAQNNNLPPQAQMPIIDQLGGQQQDGEQKKDVLEEKGWDDEINIAIE